ncbi:hypothetical protein PF005_g10835 [Phytophthora fragariae]|uniref:Uncharacterized protein n=1 Tax=Phytophthora fragariae TaxID=53985 RepID=A0A6A3ZFD9_9STRA|nr:hypothetical protein PF003_g16378 [Phytophthora fragariae]KAE8937865.1 hypothetical protein PF009_g12248 [Phytophthora fragariae]KAE9116069.1 hypothetical protein PF007_g9804 [Phytophthora fragariae]KAE9144919.1 hypothetical protein PF006_g10197 [Phytophthora fragariae]KAE9211887.1 hypothetical protein PF005_g10835 [Phytophthora fragariae]
MERALGEPALVLCGACMDREERRWLPLCCAEDGALLVRDVCVRPSCPRLQVRGHLCVEHVLELELSWQGNYAVRACHGCRVSTLQLYDEKRVVWFILEAGEHTRGAHGVERRVKTPASADSADSDVPPVRAPGKRPLGKRPRPRRKSSRFVKQHVEKEQMRAFEWSLGNLPLEKSRHLWRDNHKRAEMEKDPMAYLLAQKPPVKEAPDVNSRPEPLEVFCGVLGCRRFAKTDNRCRFHSAKPLEFVKPTVEMKSAAMK